MAYIIIVVPWIVIQFSFNPIYIFALTILLRPAQILVRKL